jgi:hypothetical protein
VSSERPGAGEDPQQRAAGPRGEPSEEQLRAEYEAELSRLTSADLIAQAIVSLLNVAAQRLGPPSDQGDAGSGAAAQAQPGGSAAGAERDLDQVRDAIDAVRALLEILERRVPEGLRPLRDALSQLQMAYAREVQAGAGAGGDAVAGHRSPAEEPAGGQPAGGAASESQAQPGEPGPAQRSGRLWVPGS